MKTPLWLTVTLSELPDTQSWLSRGESEVLAGLHLPRRRRDWMLGRWAAKRAALVAAREWGGMREADVEIIAAADGAPEAWLDGRPAPFTISLSHRGGLGACLVAAPGVMAGCDIELVEPRAPVFAADWFTNGELAQVAVTPPARRDLAVTVIWSVKESVLKALRQGLRLDPRGVDVVLAEPDVGQGGWRPAAAFSAGRRFAGWWRREDQLVMTAVTDPAGSSPALLKESCEKKEKV
jgi:4'-phosphopantetheinyl transferase